MNVKPIIPQNSNIDQTNYYTFGKISFKENINKSDSFSFFPEEHTLYIFDANLPHRPELSPNSDFSRIVLGGNVTFNFKK